jgi:hypothetical protein
MAVGGTPQFRGEPHSRDAGADAQDFQPASTLALACNGRHVARLRGPRAAPDAGWRVPIGATRLSRFARHQTSCLSSAGYAALMGDCTCPPVTPPFDAAFSSGCPVHGEMAKQLLAKAIDEDKLIAEQPPGRCELCGAVAETRPYGPNGEDICFACGPGSGDPAAVAAAERAMARRLG